MALVAQAPSRLATELSRGAFPVSLELSPPTGMNPGRLLNHAAQIRSAGTAFANVADPPVGRSRMGSLMSAVLVQQRADLEAIAHVAARERNLGDLQADLIDAHRLGVRNVLCVRGAPEVGMVHAGGRPGGDLGSPDLIRLLVNLNRGRDAFEEPIGAPTSFLAGAAADPNAASREAEIGVLRRKLAGGASFVVTRPVFSLGVLQAFLERADVSVPILMGVLPLTSLGHAEYLTHEHGFVVPAAVCGRLAQARERAAQVGLEMAVELVHAARHHVQGVCVLPPRERYDLAADLAARIRDAVARDLQK